VVVSLPGGISGSLDEHGFCIPVNANLTPTKYASTTYFVSLGFSFFPNTPLEIISFFAVFRPNVTTKCQSPEYGIPIGNWSENTTTVQVSNLVPGTLNYFNVFVRDEAQNNSAYTVLAQETIHPIYLYSVHVYHGNLGGREGADAICDANIPDNMTATTVKAFLSVSEDDEIRDLPDDSTAPLPTDRILSGFPYTTGNVIANNFAGLFDSGPSVSLQDAGIATSTWMSGTNPDGSLAPNCDEWTTGEQLSTVAVGSHTSIDSAWIYWVSGYCSQNNRVIVCIAWD